MRNVYSYHLHEIFSTAVNEYTDWERTELHPINTRDATVSALSDAQFVAPVVQMADLLSAATGGDRGNGDAGDDIGGRDHAGEDTSGADGSEDGHAHDHHGAGHGDNRAYFYVFDYQFKDSEYPQVSAHSAETGTARRCKRRPRERAARRLTECCCRSPTTVRCLLQF